MTGQARRSGVAAPIALFVVGTAVFSQALVIAGSEPSLRAMAAQWGSMTVAVGRGVVALRRLSGRAGRWRAG
ncbi:MULTISPECIES: hypothetical protein [Phycicoccus]|uniref:hypothetical protein n=2 Tax=Intrasporangiaceae TaxID=85021 RepID=UPI002B70D5DC|nr:hypothetical protein [Phycicoccus elongatus]HPQ74841.1 hypothetical protein [Phycicoccus elongatus]